jgi:hypothetical protein
MQSSIAAAIAYVIMQLGLPASCITDRPDVCVIPEIKRFESKTFDGKYVPELGENIIWVNSKLDLKTVYAHSVIAHEYTHLMQYKAKQFSETRDLNPCKRETLEQVAYEMQDSYLREFGYRLKGLSKTYMEMYEACNYWTQKQKEK